MNGFAIWLKKLSSLWPEWAGRPVGLSVEKSEDTSPTTNEPGKLTSFSLARLALVLILVFNISHGHACFFIHSFLSTTFWFLIEPWLPESTYTYTLFFSLLTDSDDWGCTTWLDIWHTDNMFIGTGSIRPVRILPSSVREPTSNELRVRSIVR